MHLLITISRQFGQIDAKPCGCGIHKHHYKEVE